MEFKEAILVRHSVRAYLDKPVESQLCEKLQALIEECNQNYNLHIQLITNEPKAFDCLLAHYGRFSGVKNYIALIGKKCDGLDEKIGYCGEKIVLLAQTLGLNTCWVAMTYKKIKRAFTVGKDEKLRCILALGYGKTQGCPHKIKTVEEVSEAENAPVWFIEGVKAALLAPTAVNQQKFIFTLVGENKVSARTKIGVCNKIDLGIAKYHFELGAGKENFEWL